MGEIVTSPVQGRPEGPGKPLSDLVFSQLRINYRPWISVLAVTAVSTGCVLLGMATVQAGAGAPNAVERVYNQLGSSVAAFIAVAAVVAISLTAAVCVRVQRLDVALWMLAGVQPKQAAWVVRCEVWITSLLGSLLGVVLGYAAWPLWVGLLGGSRLPDTPALHAPPPASAAVLALIICLLTALCGGGKAARLTRRVRPLEVLQQTDQTKRAFGWGRAVWAALLGLSVVLCYVAVAIMKPGQESGQQMIESSLVVYLISGILLVALMAVCGQYLLGGSLAAWTGLVPRQLSLAWYLARNRAHADVDFSSALVTPLIVATGTVGALYGWLAAMLDASRVLGQRFEGNGLPVTDVVVSVGGPVLIAAVATAGVLFATSVDKVRETVLLRVAGASRRTLSLKGAMEAFIYAATAAIMSALLMAANSAAFAWVLNIGPVPGASFAGIPWQPFLICVGGFVLILLVAVPTVNRAAKRDPVEILGTN